MVSRPFSVSSGSETFSGKSSPRGILMPKFRSRRKTMSSRSIDSAPRSLRRLASGVHVFFINAEGVHEGGSNLFVDLFLRRHDILA